MTDRDDEFVCPTHNLSKLPTGYDRCPLCIEEERIRAEIQHLMTRDRRVEPW